MDTLALLHPPERRWHVYVLELKRSIVAVSEGIRQSLDSQKKTFIKPFYTTVQLVMTGNDTEGLRYSMIETPEKYWLRWKESEADPGTTRCCANWDRFATSRGCSS